MKARDVVGRKIVGVKHHRFKDDSIGWVHVVRCLVLDDGSEIHASAYDTEAEPTGDMHVWKRPAPSA